MLDFIRLLRTRYQSILNHIAEYSAYRIGYETSVRSLIFAEACLKKNELIRHDPKYPIQVVVLGPTQAGKSTLVNLLTREELAGVSPLAGFTVQAQGICYGIEDRALTGLDDFFSPAEPQLRDRAGLGKEKSYVLVQAQKTNSGPLFPCVVWDTPDFDSVDADGYQRSVLRSAALADVIVLIVSKEKYADQSVWDMLALLESLANPMVVCINKVPEQSESVLIDSFLETWKNVRSDAAPLIQTLSYRDAEKLSKTLDRELFPLVRQINTAIGQINRKDYPKRVNQLLRDRWMRWVDPVKSEHHFLDEWHEAIDEAITNALVMYKRDYLDHPRQNETFQRALIELLSLLEIPALASAFVQIRRVVTWPIRQTIKLGKTITKSTSQELNPTQEVMILEQISEHFLIQLSEAVLEKIEEASGQDTWWTQIGAQLRHDKEDLLDRFRFDAERYHKAFLPEIEKAARRLYRKLENQPAILNSLRATRVTTDAVAVALAIKTSGLGIHDVVVTPAILTITSMLTESALGSYMNKVVADLKHRQFDIVKTQLFEYLLKEKMYRLPERLNKTDKFGIAKETLTSAENNLA